MPGALQGPGHDAHPAAPHPAGRRPLAGPGRGSAPSPGAPRPAARRRTALGHGPGRRHSPSPGRPWDSTVCCAAGPGTPPSLTTVFAVSLAMAALRALRWRTVLVGSGRPGLARSGPHVHLLPPAQHHRFHPLRSHPDPAGPVPAPCQRDSVGRKRPGGPERRDRAADLRRPRPAGAPHRRPGVPVGDARHQRAGNPGHPGGPGHDQAAKRGRAGLRRRRRRATC